MPFVQGSGIQSVGSVASVSKTFASNVTAGNCVVACGIASNMTGVWAGNKFTDTLGNTYVLDPNNYAVASGQPCAAIAYDLTSAGGACTVTLTDPDGVGDWLSIGIAEVSGVSARDTSAKNTANNASATSGNIVTTGAAILLGVLSHGGSTISLTGTGGSTEIFQDSDANDMPIVWAYKEVTPAGTYTMTWTLGAAVTYSLVAIALLGATPASLEQEGYRFRNDDGSEAAATWKAAQDTDVTLTPDSPARLRGIANATGDVASKQLQLEYRKVGTSTWNKV